MLGRNQERRLSSLDVDEVNLQRRATLTRRRYIRGMQSGACGHERKEQQEPSGRDDRLRTSCYARRTCLVGCRQRASSEVVMEVCHHLSPIAHGCGDTLH